MNDITQEETNYNKTTFHTHGMNFIFAGMILKLFIKMNILGFIAGIIGIVLILIGLNRITEINKYFRIAQICIIVHLIGIIFTNFLYGAFIGVMGITDLKTFMNLTNVISILLALAYIVSYEVYIYLLLKGIRQASEEIGDYDLSSRAKVFTIIYFSSIIVSLVGTLLLMASFIWLAIIASLISLVGIYYTVYKARKFL